MKKIAPISLIFLCFAVAAGSQPAENIKATGTMYFIFDMATETTINGVLFARFVPDKKSTRYFPAITSGKYPGLVRYISLEPAERILEATLGNEQASLVSHGARPREIKVPVEVELSDYKPEVECDSRVYYAKLVTVKTGGTYMAASGDVPRGC